VVGPQAVQIAFGPGGIVVLWLLAADLAGLALWRLIEATSTCPPGSPPSPGSRSAAVEDLGQENHPLP
jgi:hypothetical protein